MTYVFKVTFVDGTYIDFNVSDIQKQSFIKRVNEDRGVICITDEDGDSQILNMAMVKNISIEKK